VRSWLRRASGFRAAVCFHAVMFDVGKFDAGALYFTLDDIIGSEL